MCCKIFSIEEISKHGAYWCPHCNVGVGCRIYDQRPTTCRSFQCGYLVEPELDEQWKPSVSHLVIFSTAAYLDIHVDPKRSDAWRREPYYSSIKQWTKEALEVGAQVRVFVGLRVWMTLPDGDVDLGLCSPSDTTVIKKTFTPSGAKYGARIVNSADPAAAEEVRRSPYSMESPDPMSLGERFTLRKA
jgi:hypothetical protein